MSKIYVTGDTHRFTDIQKLIDTKIKTKLTKEDYVIIAGDFGGVWDKYGSDYNKAALDKYDSFPWTTLWVDGNHENFDALKQYPVTTWNGGLVQHITDSVIHLMRGQVFTIDGTKFFTMGGGNSIDKMFRTEGLSWWKDEMPSQKEYETAIKNLEKHDMTVDYIITHCCGDKCLSKLMRSKYHDEMNDWFDHLEDDFPLKYKHWYFGHYHLDKKADSKHTCLYDKIIKIK